MTSLSKVSDVTRKFLEICGSIVLGLILLVVLFNIGVFIKNIISPTPPPAPSVSFGKLPNISFPQGNDNKTYSYTINTLSGSLPTLPDRVTVYKLTQPSPDLLALQKATDIATSAKFVDQPTALSDVLYRWTKSDPFPSTLTLNIQTHDFLITSDYKSDATVTNANNLPSQDVAQTVSNAFFDSIMPLPANIDTNKTKTTLLAIGQNSLTPASSLSTAQIIRIDYFYQNVENLPILTSNPATSLIYSLVASGETDYPQVVEAQYYHKDLTKDKATYPIKTAQEALTELKQGKGFIAANPDGDTSINITDVTLGYYVDIVPQQYLWPIIVFQGDKGFYAYVSAIPDDWIKAN